MANRADDDGYGEGFQRGFAIGDAISFTRLMLELYEFRCAITGQQYRPAKRLPHPQLDVYLLQPLDQGGQLSFANAIVLDASLTRQFDEGQIVVSDDYLVVRRDERRVGQPLFRHADRAFWPSTEALAYHRRRVTN